MDTLRYRLDSLRKAKNTTVFHREKEEVYVHTPLHGHRSQSFHTISHPSLLDCSTGANKSSKIGYIEYIVYMHVPAF